MPYSDKEHTVSNVNYLNKDFNSFKSTLIEYAKTYYPNTYRDFNETSPGMMLIEMSAYVGDVLSFYIDQQYKEMMLPLAEERRNVINLANMLGYKVKPTSPAYVNLKFTNTVGTVTAAGGVISPDYPSGHALSKGAEVQSSTDSTIKFETLDYIDFSFSSSSDPEPTPSAFDSNGVVTSYDLVRTVKAMSAETKTKTFTIGTPSKFLTLTLSDTNVIDITSITDSNNNTWYESDFLAQEYIPTETHYSDDGGRVTAYNDGSSGTEVVPVPYTLQYTRTTKRFVTQVNEDNTTSLVFGNGILRSGQVNQSEFLQTAQVGIIIPGEIDPFTQPIDPLVNDNKTTLGETPAHTTLTVTYRIGGGITSNVVSSDLTTLTSAVSNVAVTNDVPAYGGSSGETIEEIRRRAKAYFATQNRCVTQEDYEARVLAMPAKFGNIAKVLVSRNDTGVDTGEDGVATNDINIHILSYDNNKNLVRTGTASPLRTNIKNYLDQYRIMTDEIIIDDGFIINFGVVFDVVAHKTVNKNDVKIRCINTIRNYFNIDDMQFRQALYISDLEYELMGIEGVRSVNGVALTQDFTDEVIGASGDTLWDYDLSNLDGDANTGNYGWAYSFSGADQNSEGVILPSTTPAVFELKNPNENIKGIVR